MSRAMNVSTVGILKQCKKVLEDPKAYSVPKMRKSAVDGIDALLKYYTVVAGKPNWLVNIAESIAEGWPIVIVVLAVCLTLGLTVLPWAIGIAKIFGYA